MAAKYDFSSVKRLLPRATRGYVFSKTALFKPIPRPVLGTSKMPIKPYGLFVAASLLAATAEAQVVSGVMTVTGAEMH